MPTVPGYYLDIQIVDPDFDDEWPNLCSMQHDIDAHGAVALHPDDSRLNYDPVPLCSWSYYDEGEKRKEAEKHKRYLVEREEHLRKRKASEEWWRKPAEERRIIEEAWLAAHDRSVPEEMMLDRPLARGQGRTWHDFVMVYEEDALLCQERRWPEVWRGRGFVIFRMKECVLLVG